MITLGYIIYNCTIKNRNSKISLTPSILQFRKDDESILYAIPNKQKEIGNLKEKDEIQQEELFQTAVQIEQIPEPKKRDCIQIPPNSIEVC